MFNYKRKSFNGNKMFLINPLKHPIRRRIQKNVQGTHFIMMSKFNIKMEACLSNIFNKEFLIRLRIMRESFTWCSLSITISKWKGKFSRTLKEIIISQRHYSSGANHFQEQLRPNEHGFRYLWHQRTFY